MGTSPLRSGRPSGRKPSPYCPPLLRACPRQGSKLRIQVAFQFGTRIRSSGHKTGRGTAVLPAIPRLSTPKVKISDSRFNFVSGPENQSTALLCLRRAGGRLLEWMRKNFAECPEKDFQEPGTIPTQEVNMWLSPGTNILDSTFFLLENGQFFPHPFYSVIWK